MELYAPKYVKDFVCIAHRCRHSCCIGWEIDVDPETAEHYARLNEGYGKTIAESIEDWGETPHFRLTADERCPHLDPNGLCRIILACGEDHLCEICREHPRFYHDTVRGKEMGIGMACEEACRIILSSDVYGEFVWMEDLNGDVEACGFDALSHRARMYEILSDRSLPYSGRLSVLREEYGNSLVPHTDMEWRELLASLEYLDESHRAAFSCISSTVEVPAEWELPLERALAYFIFRHCSDAQDGEELAAGLGFALLCERLIASLAVTSRAQGFEGLVELARTVSEELEYSEENTEAIKG